jgi:type IV pilus assembly protein PilM
MKLTFAKAELEKRNARAAENAKEMFKAMRPTFGDLVTETQRSLGFFGSLEKKANVKKLFMVGNAAKLPGLPQFIEKQLEIDVVKLREFERLDASGLSDDDSFKENLLTFPVSYGLVLQGLGAGQLGTNLVPREIVRARVIRRKKPWAAAIAASLLLACAFNFFFHYSAWNQVNPETEVNNVSWSSAKSKVGTASQTVSTHESTDTANQEQLARLDEIGEAIVGNDDGRKLWLELLKTVTDCLPVDGKIGQQLVSLKDRPFQERPEIFIDKIESQYFADVSEWYTEAVKERHQEFLTYLVNEKNKQNRNAAPAADSEDGEAAEPEEAEVPASPELEGGVWVIELQGHHFVRDDEKHKYTDKKYVRLTLMDQLENGRVKLPVGPVGPIEEFGVKEMGIFVPILVKGEIDRNFKKVNQDYVPPKAETTNPSGEGGGGGLFGGQPTAPADEPEDPNNPKFFYASRYKFTVQFCWQQIPLKVRLKQRIIAQKAAEEEEGL